MAKLIYVDTGATGGTYDGTTLATAYQSLSAAEAAEQADLTASGGLGIYTFRCYATGGAADTTPVVFSGWTTDATNYVLIEAATGHRATANSWDTGRYRLSVENAMALSLRLQYGRVDGLQIENYGTTTAKDATGCDGWVSSGGSYHLWSNCRIRSAAGSGVTQNTIALSDPDAVYDIVNCLCDAHPDNAGTVDGLYLATNSDAGTCRVINCTVYGVRRAVRDATGTKINVYNSAVFNNTDDFYGTFNLIDYCASDDNDGTNNVAESGGGAAWPSDFEAAGSGDFRLKSTSNLVGAGTDDPSGSGLGSPDINGTTRSDWDIGAHEYAAAAGLSIPVAMHHYRKLRS